MQSETTVPTLIRLGHVHGDLHIQPWEHAPAGATLRVLADGEPIELAADLGNDVHDDVILLVATPVELTVRAVEGDLHVRQVSGAFTFPTVHGDGYFEGVQGAVEVANVEGDLVILNHRGMVQARTVRGDLIVDSPGVALTLGTIDGDLTMRAAGTVALVSVAGDLRAQHLDELVVRDAVQGDATISHLARGELSTVRGDLTAVAVTQIFRVGRVDGEAWLRDLAAPAQIGPIGGSLAAQDLAGGLAAEVMGEAFLETSLTAGMAYDVRAESIILRVRSPISAQFVAQTERGEIRTHLPLAMERHRRNLVGVIGKGEATVTLRSQEDIVLDAAGTAQAESEPGRERRRGIRVGIPNGPQIDVDLDIDLDPSRFPFGEQLATWWPFKEAFGMSSSDPTQNEQRQQEFEQRIRDLGERTGRAARKAAEKAKDYADRAAARARDTDWEAVSRDVRTVFDRVMTELETTWKDIVTEFHAPTAQAGEGAGTAQTQGAKTTQRIPIEKDDQPIDATATVLEETPPTQATRDTQRRAILERLRNNELSLDEAEKQLQDL